MPFTTFAAGGVAAIQAAVVNTNGYPVGMQSTTLTNGQGAGMRVLRFAKKVGGKAMQPQPSIAAGDNNRNRLMFLYPPEQIGNLQFLFDALDLQAYASMSALLVSTDGNSSSVLMQSNAPVNQIQTCFIVNVDAENADSGAFGRKKFINEIYPLVNVASLLADLASVTKTEWEYYGIPTQADRAPWGTPFTVATNGATRAAGLLMTSDYPMTLDTFVGDGTTTTYNLANTPAGTTASNYILAWQGGVTFTSYSLAGKVVTFTAAPTAGSVTVIRYEALDLLSSN
jgi:hypothetical protein